MSTPYKVVDISDPAKIKEFLEEEQGRKRTDSIDDYAVTDAGSELDDDDDEELGIIPRLLFSTFSTLTLLVPLTSVHIAMDILVHQQYAQDVDAVEIAARAATAALGTPEPPPSAFVRGFLVLMERCSFGFFTWSCASAERCSSSTDNDVWCFSFAWGRDDPR